jgi:hypothetical protein
LPRSVSRSNTTNSSPPKRGTFVLVDPAGRVEGGDQDGVDAGHGRGHRAAFPRGVRGPSYRTVSCRDDILKLVPCCSTVPRRIPTACPGAPVR